MAKPTVAFFDFTCCEGCQLQVANFGEPLLDILNLITVVMFREAMSEKSETYDVAVVEGSITTPHDIERIKKIRSIAKVLIAYGSCATIGGVNGMKNAFDLADIRACVYGDKADLFPTIPTQAVTQVVTADYCVHGCPIEPTEFVRVLTCALRGIPYEVPDYAVCVECKLNENVCLYEKGVVCLGPVTRAGCNSWCVNNGNICYGCRGMVSRPAEQGQADIMQRYNIRPAWIVNKMMMYNKAGECARHEKERHGKR